MKRIILKQIVLTNFKGIRDRTIDFNDLIQDIFGANESGKSTIYNGFLWCLFGKDAEGRKDYEIKTTDEHGREIPKIEHEVKNVFEVDGRPLVLRRILKEKWTKPRGALEPIFSGNETEFYWDDVPCREKDYQDRINKLIPEELFKLLTNPLFFNQGLSGKDPAWMTRRKILMDVGGRITDAEIAAGNPEFEDLLRQMNGKSMDDFKKELGARRTKVKGQHDMMPTRIDEATRAVPKEVDFAEVERNIAAKEQEIAGVDRTLTDFSEQEKARNKEQLDRQQRIYVHQQRQAAIEQEIKGNFAEGNSTRQAKIVELEGSVRIKDAELAAANAEAKRLSGEIATRKSQQDILRSEWEGLNVKKPDEKKDDCNCPSCGQRLPEDKIAEKDAIYEGYVKTFNENKLKRMAEIQSKGKRLATEVAEFEVTLATATTKLSTLETELASIRTELTTLQDAHQKANSSAEVAIKEQIEVNAEHRDLALKIRGIQTMMEASKAPDQDNSEYRAKRQGLTRELDEFKKQLNIRDQITQQEARVAQLEREHKDLAQQLADIEKIEFVIAEFTKAQISMLEERINGKFKHAQFKLFDYQVNGQEVPCCETMYKGVVFGTLNTAAKILVGIDIINTLSEHYGVSAPIFLDNRESVTSIPDTDAQIINLIVSPDDKELRVA